MDQRRESPALLDPQLDHTYEAEVARREQISVFRKAGKELLPLRIHAASAQDFGRHYFLRAANGISIFDSEDRFSVELARQVLIRVITGKGAA